MAGLPNGLKDRNYGEFKDTELFGSILASNTVGSVVLDSGQPRVGDILVFNSGSTDIYINLWTSGAGLTASTSGTLLEAGAKQVYENVGFDVLGTVTAAGVSKTYMQKLYSSR